LPAAIARGLGVLLRLFFLVLLVFVVLLLIRGYLARSRQGRRVSAAEDDMALDPQCQTYVPKREAVVSQGRFFCSRDCAERYLAQHRADE
jgi:uncharacterized protein